MATTSCCCSLQLPHISAPIVSSSASRWVAPSASANLSSQSALSCNLIGRKLARGKRLQECKVGYGVRGRGRSVMRVVVVEAGLLPVDPWSLNTDTQSIASSLFAASLLPYLGFLYHLTKSKTSPKLTLFGFYFLLAFVGATIPAGIYAKLHYGTSLSNVDWLHGGAESLLTLTNLFIVFGLRDALKKPLESSEEDIVTKEEKNVPLSK